MTTKPDFTLEAPAIPPGAIADEVHLDSLVQLGGHSIEYRYSSGRTYSLRFFDDRLTFRRVDENGPPWVTLPYRARKLAEQLYLVHFLVPKTRFSSGPSGHVALILDLENAQIHAAGLIPGQAEQFDLGQITQWRTAVEDGLAPI